MNGISNEEERDARVRLVESAEKDLRVRFDRWFKAADMIDYGTAKKNETYLIWKSGYITGLADQ